MLTEDDKYEVEQRVKALFSFARPYFQDTLCVPGISWRRSGKNAGTANLTANRINFNPVLFTHNRQAYFDEVIPHEVSHIIVFQVYGRVQPHGRQWQWVMENIFNTQASTTHSFDLTPLELKTFIYRCMCGDNELSVRRHNKVVRNEQQYICRRCRKILTYAPHPT